MRSTEVAATPIPYSGCEPTRRRLFHGSLRAGLLLTAAAVLLPAAARAQATDSTAQTSDETTASASVTSPDYPGVTCQILQAPMRDGTLLRTTTYFPAGQGPFPVVMQRNPYQRLLGSLDCFQPGLLGGTLPVLAQNGYVAMDQAVRGTYLSQGTFHAMTQEAQDGYDAIEWAAAQPWSTGKIGMMSGSYLGLRSGSQPSTRRRIWPRSRRPSPPPTTTTTGPT